MTKVAYGKSQKWLDTHCSLCDKKFSPKEDRAKGHWAFKNDEELVFLACEPCSKSADITTAVEQIKTIGEDWKSHQKMVVA
jgi:hypothetical protein